MSEVELIDISHHFGNQPALKNVSVEFPQGEITAIIGRSGSGKTTLLRSINGLVSPGSGTVRVFGKTPDPNTIHELRRRIGYVVQGNGLFPHLTIYDNISISATIAGNKSSDSKTRVQALLDLVNLPAAYLTRYPFQLSGGEQQRVAICRALFLQPRVLLMDEPFASLDTVNRREIGAQLLSIKKSSSITIIIVTHDVSEAFRLADHIMVIDGGTLQQFGTKESIISSPATDLVKELIELR